MKTFFLLSALLAGSVMGQESDRPEELVLIGMRTLEGVELARYRSVEAEIRRAFAGDRGVTDAIETAQRLNEMISSTNLFPAAQNFLRSTMREQVFSGSAEPGFLARELLAATSPDLRLLAFDYLLNASGWDQDKAIQSELVRLFGDSGSSADERSTIAWLLASKGLFEAIQDVALSLARDHDDANLAHSIARTIVAAHEDDGDALARFARSDARALREETARSTYRCGDVRPTSTVAMFSAIARDKSEPEWVRGDAIDTLALCPSDPVHQAALVNLLDRSSWFFGAVGQHFLVHSLALVIPPLAESDNPAIRSRLVALRTELPALRSDEREYVEWVLGNALGECREAIQIPPDTRTVTNERSATEPTRCP